MREITATVRDVIQNHSPNDPSEGFLSAATDWLNQFFGLTDEDDDYTDHMTDHAKSYLSQQEQELQQEDRSGGLAIANTYVLFPSGNRYTYSDLHLDDHWNLSVQLTQRN